MEIGKAVLNHISPQEQVFGLEELLSLILEYASPNREKHDLLRYRSVGRVWTRCASRMFREPPFKICLEPEDMLQYRKINTSTTLIPMEVTVKGYLSRRKLDFLARHSANVEILHLVGVESVEENTNNPPHLLKLKKLSINNQFEPYYKQGKMFDFINNMAKHAPKLEIFKVIFDESVTCFFQKGLKGYILPKLMTDLKAVNVGTYSLEKILAQSNLSNLTSAELHLKRCFLRRYGISRILSLSFGNIRLKKLKLHFEPPQDEFMLMYPLHHLEEFETNVSIITFDRITPLSVCLPKLKRFTCKGGLMRTLTTLLLDGSSYENLESLTLHGSTFHRYAGHDLPGAGALELALVNTINQRSFPSLPNLVSLTWKGFSARVTAAVVPRIFAHSKHLSELDIGLDKLLLLCIHFLSDANLLAGTNFNRLTTLSIHKDTEQEFHSRLLYNPISISLPYLETITLGENICIYSDTKMLWELSGRQMIVDPNQVTKCTWPDREAVLALDPFNLNFGLGKIKKL